MSASGKLRRSRMSRSAFEAKRAFESCFQSGVEALAFEMAHGQGDRSSATYWKELETAAKSSDGVDVRQLQLPLLVRSTTREGEPMSRGEFESSPGKR